MTPELYMMRATEVQSISKERKVCVRLPMKKSFLDLPIEELVFVRSFSECSYEGRD